MSENYVAALSCCHIWCSTTRQLHFLQFH